MRIYNAGLKCAARGSLEKQDPKESPQIHRLGTMAQLCQPISSQLIALCIWEVGVAGSPVIGRRRGAFPTLLRQPGPRAYTGGILATKSECKMLASTHLYSLYACSRLVIQVRKCMVSISSIQFT